MSKFLEAVLGVSLLVAAASPAAAGPFGRGRTATPDEIAAWNRDVTPDGQGLPAGSGDAYTGEEIFAEKCAVCHGDFAEGVGNWPKLAGGMDTLDHEDPLKTVGSYWPHLTTTWDYVNRSMPFGDAQSLEPDEVYAIVAYILYSNDLIEDDYVLSNENLATFELPNLGGFIMDDRDVAELPDFTREPCMTDCKAEVKITMRARVLDVTPDDEGANASALEAATVAEETAASDIPVTVVETSEPAAEPAPEPEAPAQTASVDPAMVAEGENVFKKCKACHQVGDGAKNRTGPVLNGIVGHAAGAVDGYKYSKGLQAAAEEGLVWNDATLAEFLTKPKSFIKGTKMSFAGLKKQGDIDAIIAYLQSFPGQ